MSDTSEQKRDRASVDLVDAVDGFALQKPTTTNAACFRVRCSSPWPARAGTSSLKKNLRAFHGAVGLPFTAGEHRRIAVKIIDDRGIESLKVVNLETS